MKVLLFNPRSNFYKPRITNTILQVAASIEGLFDYVIVDGNLENDPWSVIESHLKKGDITVAGFTVMPGPQLNPPIASLPSPTRCAGMLQAWSGTRRPAPPAASWHGSTTTCCCDGCSTSTPTSGSHWTRTRCVSPQSGEAALRAAGAGVAAVDAVMHGEVHAAFCAVRPPGHHATRDLAMGFCLFDNVAVAAAHALERHGLSRISIVDFDVHHGNGTQAIFEHEPRVQYLSTHQAPLFPDTGDRNERGVGNIFNQPLPAGTDGERFAACGACSPRHCLHRCSVARGERALRPCRRRSRMRSSMANGFDGEGFQPETWYAVQGRLTRQAPSDPVETVNLSGLYMVPPFGEAHNHNVEGTWSVQAVAQRYLQDGVFYVKNPNDVRDFALQIRQAINVPTSIDVTFAHAGLTGRGGHPVALYEDVLRIGRYEPVVGLLERGWFENRSYVVVDTDAEVEAKWPMIVSGRPDFIKVYLVHSEDDGEESKVKPAHHRKGLHPALLPGIVSRAHAAGLQVTAHVETAADFRQAIDAGVDELAHVPGWLLQGANDVERGRLTEDDARLAAAHKV